MAWSKCLHRLVDGFNERQHGLLQLAFELRFMGLKPLPAVVSFKAARNLRPASRKYGSPAMCAKEDLVILMGNRLAEYGW